MVLNNACVWVKSHIAFYANENGAFVTCTTVSLSVCSFCPLEDLSYLILQRQELVLFV